MEVFDVFLEKFSVITQEPIQQGFKKTFPHVQRIFLMKKYVFLEKVSIVFFSRAPSEFFLAVMKKNFSQDCQNCIILVQMDVLRFFDKVKWNLAFFSGKRDKTFSIISKKKQQICHYYKSRGKFREKRFFDRNVIDFCGLWVDYFQNLVTTAPAVFSKQYFTCPVWNFEEN